MAKGYGLNRPRVRVHPHGVSGTSSKLTRPQQRTVSFQMPQDPHAFIAEHKDKDIDGELCVRSMGLHEAERRSSYCGAGPRRDSNAGQIDLGRTHSSIHQLGQLYVRGLTLKLTGRQVIAGAKSPRASTGQDGESAGEPWGAEVCPADPKTTKMYQLIASCVRQNTSPRFVCFSARSKFDFYQLPHLSVLPN